MADLLARVLGAPILTAAVRTGAMVPDSVFPTEFFAVTDRVVGDRFAYRKYAANAATAKRVNYGSPSVRRGLVNVGSASVIMIHTNEHIMHDFLTYQNLCSPDNTIPQQLAVDEITRQSDEFSTEIKNLRLGAMGSLMATGTISFDANDELLVSTNGAAFSVDYQIPTGNQNQLNVFGDGNLITTAWSNPAADIEGDIRKMQQAALKKHGRPLRYAMMGVDIMKFLLTNTVLKEYFVRNPAFNSALLNGTMQPDPVFGLIWIPAYLAWYKDSAGVQRTFFPNDRLTLLPAVDKNWYRFSVGSFPVPTVLGNVFSAVESAAASIELVFGQFGYARLTNEDPVGLKQCAGDTFMPGLPNPDCMFLADVDF